MIQPNGWASYSIRFDESVDFLGGEVRTRTVPVRAPSMLHRILEAAGEGIRDLHSARLKSVLCNLQFSGFREKEKNSGVCAPDVSDGQRDRTFQFGASCARGRTEPVSSTAREGAVSAAGHEIESLVGIPQEIHRTETWPQTEALVLPLTRFR